LAGCDGDGYTPFSKDLEIWDWYDLDDIRDNVYGNHILMNDLDSTTPGYAKLASEAANGGKGWKSIILYFQGVPIGLHETFDGQGYEIRDLFINRPGEDYVGLFHSVEPGGVIQDIGVVNATVIGGKYVGGLVGCNHGTVSDSYSTGSVSGNEHDTYVGGLVGSNTDGTVSDSYSTGNVTGNSHVGGLVGSNEATVNNSFWDTETSGQATSDGGTGKNTTEMQDIITFSGAAWNITAVALNETNPAYIWNIVNNVTYPFLSWQRDL